MKKIIGLAVAAAVGMGTIAPTALAAGIDNLPPNAIVSEGNGAAVFIGYGGDSTVNLEWRPSKQFEKATMLYQVQRSDGAIVVSRSNATSYTDRNLTPNTAYTYTLSAYQTVDRDVKIKKGKQKGKTVKKTVTKMVGQNTITVLTLPGEVTGLYNPSATPRYVKWQPPANQENSLRYNIYVSGNLWEYDYPNLEYRFPNDLLVGTKNSNVKVCAVNDSGEAKKCPTVSVPFG